MEERIIYCLSCQNKMNLLTREDIQLGKESLWHKWNHLIHGALDVEIYICPRCGKLEFFLPVETLLDMDAAKKNTDPKEIVAYKCTNCGKIVSTEVRCCPSCGETDEPMLPQIRCPNCGTVHDFDDPKCPYCNHPVA